MLIRKGAGPYGRSVQARKLLVAVTRSQPSDNSDTAERGSGDIKVLRQSIGGEERLRSLQATALNLSAMCDVPCCEA